MLSMHRAWWVGAAVVVAGALVWGLCSRGVDPREVLPGDWREATAGFCVDVSRSEAQPRGVGLKGKAVYTWVQADREPYLLHVKYRRYEADVRVYIHDRDTVTLEPLVWEQLSAEQQASIAQINRMYNRPPHELKFLFRRQRKR